MGFDWNFRAPHKLDFSRHQNRVAGANLRVRVRADVRRQVQVKRLAISLLVIAMAGVGAVSWFGFRYAADNLFRGNERYNIRDIEIVNGGAIVRDFIRGKHHIEEGANIFSFDIETVQSDFLKGAPSFKKMEITRVLPDILRIDVVERTPLARVGKYGSLAADNEGAVFGLRGTHGGMAAITGFSGQDLRPGDTLTGVMRDAVALLDVCDKTLIGHELAIREVDVRGGFGGRDDSLRLELDGGTTVDFWWNRSAEDESASRKDLGERLSFLAGVIKRSKRDGQALGTVDLTLDSYRHNCPVTPRWN